MLMKNQMPEKDGVNMHGQACPLLSCATLHTLVFDAPRWAGM